MCSDAITYAKWKSSHQSISVKDVADALGLCAFDAIENQNWNANEILGRKMAEYSRQYVMEDQHSILVL